MERAEERALEAYPIVMSQHSDNCKEYDSNESDRLTFIEGYHQAEKDLELTSEYIYVILYSEREVMREFGKEDHTNEEICMEVLKRFKDLKNENQEL